MLGPLKFQAQTPLDDEALKAHVKHALSLGLPELPASVEQRPGVLRLIANGPSARQAPLDGLTCSVNGSLALFTEQGLHPTFWAACDPQELVANFLVDAPEDTVYLIASKCHPRVFETLLSRGRHVLLWHVDDFATWSLVCDRKPVSTALTITLTIFEVFERLGCPVAETWGWDGCFMDGRGHAVPQAGEGEAKEVDFGSQTFISSGTWVMEAENAAHRLLGYPYPLSICGGGMIGAVMQRMWQPEVAEVLTQATAA